MSSIVGTKETIYIVVLIVVYFYSSVNQPIMSNPHIFAINIFNESFLVIYNCILGFANGTPIAY